MESKLVMTFDPKVPRLLGVVEVLLAGLSVILDTIAIIKETNIQPKEGFTDGGTEIFIIGFEYWCPIFYILSGGTAIVISKTKTRRGIRVLLVTSIISVIMGVMQFCALSVVPRILQRYGEPTRDRKICTALAVMLLIIGVIEAALSTWLCKICTDQLFAKKTSDASNLPPSQVLDCTPGKDPHVKFESDPNLYQSKNITNLGVITQQNIILNDKQTSTNHPEKQIVSDKAGGQTNGGFIGAVVQAETCQGKEDKFEPPPYEDVVRNETDQSS